MSIMIGALEFEGPYADLDNLSDESGLFAVLCHNFGEHELIEIGEADYVREHVVKYVEEQSAWYEADLDIAIAVHYTPDLSAQERQEIKASLELEFDVEVAA